MRVNAGKIIFSDECKTKENSNLRRFVVLIIIRKRSQTWTYVESWRCFVRGGKWSAGVLTVASAEIGEQWRDQLTAWQQQSLGLPSPVLLPPPSSSDPLRAVTQNDRETVESSRQQLCFQESALWSCESGGDRGDNWGFFRLFGNPEVSCFFFFVT